MKSSPVQYHLGEFPPNELNWSQLIPLIGPANAGLARYDGLLFCYSERSHSAFGP